MTERLNEIFSVIPKCESFADVGCDHGLMTEAMLKSGKCSRAVVSDVSQKCLEKAQSLLAEYIDDGRVISIVSDGFDNLPKTECALIAGMGGEEICSIIKRAKNLPETLVLQPMKNTDKVRVTAVELGYKIVKDYLFYSGKIFYDLLVLTKGEDCLTEEEIEFGRTNLIERSSAFIEKIKTRIAKIDECLENPALSTQTKTEMAKERDRLKKYV
jgi:tRNA (adenine22-N1)-methyltransferase